MVNTMMNITQMTLTHKQEVFDMMDVFYHSDAVSTDGSKDIYLSDIDNCIGDCPFVEGYVFEHINDADEKCIAGYGMLAKSFSTEFGKLCIWIEDIYIKPEFRGLGYGSSFLAFVEKKYAGYLLRIEVEDYNEAAVHTYKKAGFEELPYMELKK